MKALRLLAIILPICAILVACGGEKSEPDEPTDAVCVTAQDLCDYLPYVEGQKIVFANKTTDRQYHVTVQSIKIDTANIVGSIEYVFAITSPSVGDIAELHFLIEMKDTKSGQVTYICTYGEGGYAKSGATYFRELPLSSECGGLGWDGSITVKAHKGIVAIAGFLEDDMGVVYTPVL